ncbi:hypothetical protein [Sphingomonas jaspsi]|uniref:hypothetical protein n=1 Tax=Sphingomonas jaspsi TaxID=392409 RepID=UPI0005612FE4|nr:hypothetical protein [Sphingomonas jaspsi]
MVNRVNLPLLVAVLISLFMAGCKQPTETPEATVGDNAIELSISVSGFMEGARSVDIKPGQYAVLFDERCPDRPKPPNGQTDGQFCLVSITEEQSRQLEAAMAPFLKSAVPLSSYSVAQYANRPDGKPCKSRATDGTMIGFIWMRADRSQIATFDSNCDPDEFRDFYRQALAVIDLVPSASVSRAH